MGEPSSAIKDLADAYRAAMRAGDQRFAGDAAQRKILQAIVFDSAARVEQWVKTRVPDGNLAAKPLSELTPELAKGNLVGQGLKGARDEAVKQARAVASAAIAGTAIPAGVGAVLAFFGGVFGFSQEAGLAFGSLVIPTLFAGGSVLFVLMRAAHASAPLVEAAGGVAGSAMSSAGAIGTLADVVFREHVGPALAALAGLGYQPPREPPVLTQLRAWARGILLTVYGILAVCVLFFLAGIGDAFTAYQECRIRLDDGTCIGS
jgi:hypothetical protein